MHVEMNKLTGKTHLRTTIVAFATALAMSWAHAGEPLKVYLLVGQSNMQGTANISTAKHMAADPKTKALYDKIIDGEGKPRVYEDVRIAAFSQGRGNTDTEKTGPLTFGYGSGLTSEDVCGPELGFGVTMREIVGGPILIIKTSWGGKSLYQDFRPPSAGPFEAAKNPEATGHYYRLMVEHVKKVLKDPGKYHPAYKESDGYQLEGFVWFQGWNDMVNGGVYKNRYQPGGRNIGWCGAVCTVAEFPIPLIHRRHHVRVGRIVHKVFYIRLRGVVIEIE